jgi:phosphoserine aminotransferase
MWSNQNVNEMKKFAKVNIVTDAIEEHDCTDVSDPSKWNIDKDASFFYMCTNETVNGIEFDWDSVPFHLIPKDMPICCDMSSNIGTNVIPWDKGIGVVFAGT